MKKRFLALVMVCTMVMTVPVFAVTVDQAKKDVNEVEAGIQGIKQWTDTTQVNVNGVIDFCNASSQRQLRHKTGAGLGLSTLGHIDLSLFGLDL